MNANKRESKYNVFGSRILDLSSASFAGAIQYTLEGFIIDFPAPLELWSHPQGSY